MKVLTQPLCVLLLLGLDVQAVNDVEHGVAGKGVVACLCASLGVEDGVDGRDLAENIHACEAEFEVAFEYAFGEGGVPAPVCGVEFTCRVAAAQIEFEVGLNLEIIREANVQSERGCEVEGIDYTELLLRGSSVTPKSIEA